MTTTIVHDLLTLTELCEHCNIEPMLVETYIAYEIIKPSQVTTETWLFDATQVNRFQKALRLQQDLQLNLIGTALILDLLEERNQLQTQIHLLEQYWLK